LKRFILRETGVKLLKRGPAPLSDSDTIAHLRGFSRGKAVSFFDLFSIFPHFSRFLPFFSSPNEKCTGILPHMDVHCLKTATEANTKTGGFPQ